MSPELIYIIELFAGFCVAFFVPYYVIQKLVESFKKSGLHFESDKNVQIEEPNYTTNPAYNYNLYNTFHKN